MNPRHMAYEATAHCRPFLECISHCGNSTCEIAAQIWFRIVRIIVRMGVRECLKLSGTRAATRKPEPLTNGRAWYSIYTMEFEFDPDKSEADRRKHGIDFVQAQALWDDLDLLEIPARTSDEPRWVVIGRIEDKHWSGIFTRREGRIRLISVRRSRKEEVELYES